MSFDADNSAKYDVYNDVNLFRALLLVKDFDSHELTTDDTFMTNADTPTLACSGLIEKPINPFTGKKINSSYKNKQEHHIAFTESWGTTENNGNTFIDTVWIGLKGNNATDASAWRIIGDRLD